MPATEARPAPLPTPKSLDSGTITPALDRVGVAMSEEAYLAQEPVALDKHEYYDGKAWLMAGGSVNHSLIANNLRGMLFVALQNSPCVGLDSEMRVAVPGTERRYYYPDASVVCGTITADKTPSLLNPVALVEVLSGSTAAFDRGEKFENYQKIESLRHYILIEQDRISVTHYEKIAGNLWAIVALLTDLGDSLTLSLADATVTVPLEQIYRRVFTIEPDAPNA